jgi:hypothetical protein
MCRCYGPRSNYADPTDRDFEGYPTRSPSIDYTSCITEPQTRSLMRNFIDRISSGSSIQYRDQLMPATIPNFIDHKLLAARSDAGGRRVCDADCAGPYKSGPPKSAAPAAEG